MFSVPNLYRLPPHDHHGASARSVLGPSLFEAFGLSSGLGGAAIRMSWRLPRPKFRRSLGLWLAVKLHVNQRSLLLRLREQCLGVADLELARRLDVQRLD